MRAEILVGRKRRRRNACVDGTNKHVLSGPIRVTDGDTVVIAGERVRFLGMGSPEEDQLVWPQTATGRAGWRRRRH